MHVLVWFDSSTRGRAALKEATAIARTSGARLTVLALAPVERPSRCCNLQTTFWNREMRRHAEEAIDDARSLVGNDIDVQFVVRDGAGRRVAAEVAAELGCALIVEPARGRPRRRRSVSVTEVGAAPARAADAGRRDAGVHGP